MAPHKDDAQVKDNVHSLDGCYSNKPLKLEPKYSPLIKIFAKAMIITNIPKVYVCVTKTTTE